MDLYLKSQLSKNTRKNKQTNEKVVNFLHGEGGPEVPKTTLYTTVGLTKGYIPNTVKNERRDVLQGTRK